MSEKGYALSFPATFMLAEMTAKRNQKRNIFRG